MSYLYLCDQGASVYVKEGYFLVKQKDGLERKIPKETLESISIFGNIQLTTQAMKTCMEKGIPVSFYSLNGSYFGKLQSTRHTNVFRLKKQVYLSEEANFCLFFSKRIVKAKIHNQGVLLKRYERNVSQEFKKEYSNMKNAEKKIEHCNSIEELMGYEGSASRSYFSALSQIVRKEFAFHGRNRQPPRDPFNSMISLGYSLVMQEIYGALEAKGLNPYVGFMHKDRERHPTLASDLVEEWRAVIVDAVVLSMIQGNEIFTDDFERDEDTGAVFLNKKGMKTFLQKMEKKMSSEMKYLAYTDNRISFRRAIVLQVGELVKAVENGDEALYSPIMIR